MSKLLIEMLINECIGCGDEIAYILLACVKKGEEFVCPTEAEALRFAASLIMIKTIAEEMLRDNGHDEPFKNN